MSGEWSKEIFAANLKMYMTRSGRTQKELAEIVGVSAPTFNEWIKAKKYPRIDKIQKLADYFGIQKSDLIENKMDKSAEKKNDTMASIVIRMRTDEVFLDVVSSLYQLDKDKLEGVKQLLTAFK